MSLTTFLSNPAIRKKFNEEFPKPIFKEKRELLAPPLTARYSQNGSAFDYLLRFYLKRLNPKAKTRPWVAERGINALTGYRRLHQQSTKHIKETKQLYGKYLKHGVMSDDLLERAVVLAKLDSVFRASIFHPIFQSGPKGNDYRKNLLKAESIDVQDLKNIASLMKPEHFKARRLCILNPTFGRASSMIGGADADILIDDMLIEIKTVKELQLKREYFNQLIGYYCLHKLGHISNAPSGCEIKRFGIYFSRFGYLWTINIQEVVDPLKFPQFFRWFTTRVETNLN